MIPKLNVGVVYLCLQHHNGHSKQTEYSAKYQLTKYSGMELKK